MKKNIFRTKTSLLSLFVGMILFCGTWVLVFKEPYGYNLLYAISLFVGYNTLLYAADKIIKRIKRIKRKQK